MGIGHRVPCFMILNVLFILCTSTWPCFCRNTTLLCQEEERLALLEFKQSLHFEPPSLLQSWEKEDCCEWTGVACDPKSGHVTKLELLPSPSSWSFPGQFPWSTPNQALEKPFSASKLSPNISKLRYLTYLDLSGFQITKWSPIPKFIGSMRLIQFLNLSAVGFNGTIPNDLGNLTQLKVLDLNNNAPMLLSDPQWISGLKALKYLDMSNLQLGKAHDLMQVLGSLPSLVHLALSYLGMDNSQLSHHVGGPQNNSSFGNLQYLDLSGNKFQGHIPNSLFQNMSSLNYLDLSGNSFNSFESPFLLSPNLRHLNISCNQFRGQIPATLQNMTSLTHLDLSVNSFTSIPLWFTDLESLVYLDLGSNSLNHIEGGFLTLLGGKCHLRFFDLTHSDLHVQMHDGSSIGFCAFNLEVMDASLNHLVGELPDWLWNLKNLRRLSLESNQLQGVISESLGQLQSLQWLDLAGNQLSGVIPRSLGQLSKLQWLDLSDNSLGGIVSEVHFSNLFSLEGLYLGGNNLSIGIRVDWVPPFQLRQIIMRSNKFEENFPKWIQTQRRATFIDLSNASISGDMPTWPGTGMELEDLDLSHNQITGPIPQFPSNLSILDLSHNQITGPIPQFPSHLSTLDLSHNQIIGPIPQFPLNLSTLDLSHNHITGPIPQFSSNLFTLNLSYNQITGPIPQFLSNLYTLDLSHNQITGPIPEFPLSLSVLELSYNQITGPISSLPPNLYWLDLSHNLISGFIPPNIGVQLPQLCYLFLNNNLLTGLVPASLCALKYLGEIDMAKNKLSGTIPDCWGNSTSILFINWSSNDIFGHIPNSIGYLNQLMSLHLNNNSLRGVIPTTFGNLTNLQVLDLGENNFLGSLSVCISENFQRLKILRLRHNRFSGRIPQQLCHLSQLQIVDMAFNNLVGTIPPCLHYITGMIKGPMSDSTHPPSQYNQGTAMPPPPPPPPSTDWSKEQMLEDLKGREIEYTSNLIYVVALDLSGNYLVGSIPEELTHLTGLLGLNLSHNLLSGRIPEKIGDMKRLESLDFSNNHLSGTIPQSISALTFLSRLNLSNNNFTGRIPKGNQLETLYLSDHSIYAGNPLLCGDPLQKRCPNDKDAETPKTSTKVKEEDKSDSSDKMILYGVIALGFMTGFWGVIVALVLRMDWRAAYFRFAEETIDVVCVVVTVKAAKIRRRKNF